MKDPVDLSTEVENLLCTVLASEGEMVSKWVAVAEVIDPEGRRWLRSFYPAEATSWDNIGMVAATLEHMRTSWWVPDGD